MTYSVANVLIYRQYIGNFDRFSRNNKIFYIFFLTIKTKCVIFTTSQREIDEFNANKGIKDD